MNTMPKTKAELESFIIKTLSNASERLVPAISDDEQEELEILYGETLEENDYTTADVIRL